MIIGIERIDDPRLADYAHRTDVALRRAAGRFGEGPGLYLAESALVLERALAAGHRPRSVLAIEGRAAEQAEGLVGAEVPVYAGPDALLAQVTGYSLHRGLIGSMERPTLPTVDALLSGARRVVILEDVVDPTNVGAIVRSAAGIGADAVLVTPSCADPLYRRAIRVSMGTILQVPWTRTGDWASTRAVLDRHGFRLAALALEEDAIDLRQLAAQAAADPSAPLAIVLGTEGGGLTRDAIDAADTIVRIPMRHGVDSLNVAATAAVALWALA